MAPGPRSRPSAASTTPSRQASSSTAASSTLPTSSARLAFNTARASASCCSLLLLAAPPLPRPPAVGPRVACRPPSARPRPATPTTCSIFLRPAPTPAASRLGRSSRHAGWIELGAPSRKPLAPQVQRSGRAGRVHVPAAPAATIVTRSIAREWEEASSAHPTPPELPRSEARHTPHTAGTARGAGHPPARADGGTLTHGELRCSDPGFSSDATHASAVWRHGRGGPQRQCCH